MTTNNASGPYNDAQAQYVRPEHDYRRFHGSYKVSITDFRPPLSQMELDVIYLTTCRRERHPNPEKIQMAGFICPCGCGQEIHMSLKPQWENGWEFELHPDGTVSFSPSISQYQTCKAHFFIRNGMVEWC